ncbi:regulator [Streptomyces sp. SID4948]|nr:NPCBM/NEW2 domain-containing protein [Streptomyces sp. DvalAA-14]MYS24276.1 regulator [Streptomyces sp. SID4948]
MAGLPPAFPPAPGVSPTPTPGGTPAGSDPVPASNAPIPPVPTKPAPGTSQSPGPTPTPTPSPTATPTPPPPTSPPPTSPPPPPPAPVVYQVNSLPVGRGGQSAAGPTIRPGGGSWWWDRWGLTIGGTRYGPGITVHGLSTVTIDLNRACVSYDARAGVDDLSSWLGAPVRFAVYGDGSRLWSSPVVRGGDAAVPVHVGLKGVRSVELVVQPQRSGLALVALADWADARITCS